MATIHIKRSTRAHGSDLDSPGLQIIMPPDLLRRAADASGYFRVNAGEDIELITLEDEGGGETALGWLAFG